MEFAKTIRDVKKDDTIRRLRESDQLIDDLLYLREEAVAAQIEKIHAEEASIFYNNEQSLRGAIRQIKEKHYPRAFENYGGEIIIAGINYNKDAPAGQRKHDCVIEKLELRD